MLIDGTTLSRDAKLQADVCIMGGGVAGLVLARELAGDKVSVIVLESGGEGYQQPAQSLYRASQENPGTGYPDPEFSRLRMLGGSSNHWENNTSPLDPIDFEKRSWIPGSGWPIGYADLAPFYDAAGEYVGVGPDGYDTAYWAAQLSLEDVVKSSSLLATGIAKASLPPTRFYAAYGEALVDHPLVTIITQATVVDIEFDQSQQMVSAAAFETEPGNRIAVAAKKFVMCFGGIENARMLLHFNEKYNDQLGNRQGLVGRYFMDHPVVRGASLFPDNVDALGLYQVNELDGRMVVGFLQLARAALEQHQLTNIRMPLVPTTHYYMSDGISSHHIMQDAFANGELPDNFGTHLMNFIKDIDMVAEAVARKAFKKKLFSHADEFSGYLLSMMIEQTPNENNRISLGDDRDPYGVKRVVIDWSLSADDRDRFWRGLEIAGRGVGAEQLGRLRILKEREERMFGDQLSFGHHHSGTTRMAANEQQGVVDKHHRVFGSQNLFVAGSSVFPTIGHVTPTLTIAAMAIRLAGQLAQEVRND